MGTFPYAERAEAVRAARARLAKAHVRASAPQTQKPGAPQAQLEAAEAFRAACAAAYPPDFWLHARRVKARRSRSIGPIIEFLEADPVFPGTGWHKASFARLLQSRNMPLSDGHIERLKRVVLNLVRHRNTYEFREYCRLAYRLRDHNLDDRLREIAGSRDKMAARRAKWMMQAIRLRRFKRLTGNDVDWSIEP